MRHSLGCGCYYYLVVLLCKRYYSDWNLHTRWRKFPMVMVNGVNWRPRNLLVYLNVTGNERRIVQSPCSELYFFFCHSHHIHSTNIFTWPCSLGVSKQGNKICCGDKKRSNKSKRNKQIKKFVYVGFFISAFKWADCCETSLSGTFFLDFCFKIRWKWRYTYVHM